MRKVSISLVVLATLLILPCATIAAQIPLQAVSLDAAPFPDYNYTRANKLPLTGYFKKSFELPGGTRTAAFYIPADAPIRAFFFVITVPDGAETADFIQKSGWKALADANESGLFLLEPGKNGWGALESELAYINAANAFYRGNRYFSIFGENYLVGYGAGSRALEAWAAATPLFVMSQVYVDSPGLPASYFGQFATRYFDGLTSGYTKIQIPEALKIAYNRVPVPTWFINATPDPAAASIAYWKGVNDCTTENFSRATYLLGSTIHPQAKDSKAWQTDYCGPISKVATLQRSVDIWNPATTTELYRFLTQYVRYDVSSAYGNQLGIRAPMGDFFTMMVNGFVREYMVYVPDSAAKLWTDGAPLLMIFPGDSQTDKVFWPATQWWKVADQEGVILVTLCEHYSRNSTVVSHKDNEYFVPQLLNLIKATYPVDDTRIYATGQSAGSVAAQGFGMSNPDYFAAIASTSGVANFNASDWATQLKTATNRPIPTYAIIGEGDIEGMIGTPWDNVSNQLDQWFNYYAKANGIASPGDASMLRKNGRFLSATWKNAQGFPMLMWGTTLYRAHNCIPAEMPMLWDFLEHWSLRNGLRYYDGQALR